MGTVPLIRVKGMSRLSYEFTWDEKSRHYAYEPKTQREADDILKTQGRLYRRMFFSVLLDDEKECCKATEEPEPDHHFIKEDTKQEAPAVKEKRGPGRPRKKKQAVEKTPAKK